MGQPELERSLERQELRQLKQRVAIRCRLSPLAGREVASYIDSRLETVGYEGKELFDSGCIEKIALYSKGIPRLINVLCDNALLIAYASSKRKVSPAMVQEAARDLQLLEPPRAKPRAKGTATARTAERKNQSHASPREPRYDLPADEPWSDFEEFSSHKKQPGRSREKRNLAGLGIGSLLTVIMLAGAGVALYSKQTGSLAALGVNFDDIIGAHWKAPVQAPPDPTPELMNEKVPDVQPPASSEPSTQETNQESTAVSQTPQPSEPQTPPAQPEKRTQKTARTTPDQTRTSSKNGAPNQTPAEAAEKLEFEVYKAIYNRAIQGVEVSVQDGTVYLGGRVATDRQKLAAAQAARSVPGVRAVRDRIIVTFPTERNRSG
jgi:hypothetical protein